MSTPSRPHPRAGLAVALVLFTLGSLPAADAPKPALTFSGDLRLRYESDWDSQNAAGVARADRDRARIRARYGFAYKISDTLSFSARARTGNHNSQQSPHLSFYVNDQSYDKFDASLDRYFLQYKEGAFNLWAGRNTTPFWQQNELWWDEDVTPTGLAASYDQKLATGTLVATGGAFFLPDGMTDLNGTLLGGQLKYTMPVTPGTLTLAAGLYHLDGEEGAKNLRNRNGARDYSLGVLSAQWSAPLAGGQPLTLGVDLIKNFEGYHAADVAPLAARQAGETNGWVLSALYGQTKNPHDWQVGWFYAHVETLAVNAAYSQDDWARFGSATQADVTDFKGHEFRGTYVITKSLNIQARLFLVKAITSIQDGKRLRLDLNFKF